MPDDVYRPSIRPPAGRITMTITASNTIRCPICTTPLTAAGMTCVHGMWMCRDCTAHDQQRVSQCLGVISTRAVTPLLVDWHGTYAYAPPPPHILPLTIRAERLGMIRESGIVSDHDPWTSASPPAHGPVRIGQLVAQQASEASIRGCVGREPDRPYWDD